VRFWLARVSVALAAFSSQDRLVQSLALVQALSAELWLCNEAIASFCGKPKILRCDRSSIRV
jgi:hypothetical protein